MNTWRPLEAEGQQKWKWDAIQALCFSFPLDHICALCIHRWFSRRSPEIKGLSFSRGNRWHTLAVHEGGANEEMAPRGLQVRWIHGAQDCVLSSSRQRWEWTDTQTDSSPLCHTFAPLLSLSPSHFHIVYSSIVAPALPIPRYSTETVSSSKNLPALMVSAPKPNRLRKEGGGRRKQPTGQSAGGTCRLAGGDPWPFAPAAFSWAAESVRWPHLLNVERPLTGCRGRRRSIRRETEWEVTECDAQLFDDAAAPNLLIKCRPWKANVLQECNV